MIKSVGETRVQRIVSLICAVFFVVFSFTFLAIYQAPLLEVFYDKVATGKLLYNRFISAAVITVLLTLFSLLVNRLAKFKGSWTAFSYLPSSALLAIMTDIDRSIYAGDKHYISWIIIFVIVSLITILAALCLRGFIFSMKKQQDAECSRCLWHNFFSLSLFFVFVGVVSNGDENLKNEASAYVRYKHGNVDGALNVALKSLSATHEFTAARAFYLSQKGALGENLFEYPQQYASEGLLPPISQTTPLSPDTVYSYIGFKRKSEESALSYLNRAILNDSVPHPAIDYYLCGLLLDKRLSEFVEKLSLYYDVNSTDKLPKHYKEALILYSDIKTDYILPFDDDEIQKAYVVMQKLESEYPDYQIRSNYVRRKFGKRYWWYYNYSE